MPTIRINNAVTVVDIWCKRCGAGLCKQSYGRRKAPNVIDVEPCQICINNEVKAMVEKVLEKMKGKNNES